MRVSTWQQCFATLACLSFLSCGESSTSRSQFAITQDTIELTTYAEGLNLPRGIGIDLDSNTFRNQIFVAESGADRLLSIASDGTTTVLADQRLSAPVAMHIDVIPDALISTESESNEISRVDFSQSPAAVSVIASLPQGVFAQGITSDGEFRYVGARNTTQTNNDQIYNISSISPRLIAQGIERIGTLAFRLNRNTPELVITDSKAGRLLSMRLERDATEATTRFTRLTERLQNPTGMAIGPASGYIYICETGKDQLVRVNESGGRLEVVAKIIGCSDLTFDQTGVLYVSSAQEGKVFRLDGLNEVL